MKVIALPEVQQYLENLKEILFENEYFGFEDSAQKYVDDLFDDIITTLPMRLHKPATPYFDKYGKDMEYTVFLKTNAQHGMCFLRCIGKMGKKYILCVILATITLSHNICNSCPNKFPARFVFCLFTREFVFLRYG